MKKLLILIILSFTACKSKVSETTTATPSTQTDSSDSGDSVATAIKPIAEDTFCYLFAENRDSTTVKLIIKGDDVSGEMHWNPWEKDGAIGTLKGKKIGNEIHVDYDYVIEGSSQSEAKIFKIEGDKLLENNGELTEGKGGKLVLKNPKNGIFKAGLVKVKCK